MYVAKVVASSAQLTVDTVVSLDCMAACTLLAGEELRWYRMEATWSRFDESVLAVTYGQNLIEKTTKLL
jgi:hypothetical protein